MKPISFAVLLFISFTFNSQATPWQPPNGSAQIPIWPGAAPGKQVVGGPEDSEVDKGPIIAGKHWTWISNVVKPTITIFSPTLKKNTGAALVVFPGGGYDILAIDLEGTEVCDWATAKGMTCIVLKYRVPHAGPQTDPKCDCQKYPKTPMALQDAQRTMGYLRAHAAEWNIDPNKIGVIGFSAGGHLVADISNNYQKRSYPPLDAADRESARPNFAIALYPGHLADPKTLRDHIHVTQKTPPTMLIQAVDDPVDSVENSSRYFTALKKAKVEAEMHLFAHGKHAFGLRRTEFPITTWPELAEKWLISIGILPATAH